VLNRVCAICHDFPLPGRLLRAAGVVALACCLTTATHAQPEETADTPSESPSPTEAIDGANPLITAAEVEDWERNHRRRYSEALRADSPSAQQKEELDRGAKYYLYRMTMPENADQIYDIAQKLIEELKSVVTRPESRDYLNGKIVETSRELLDQPSDVRRTVMILLASLSSDPKAKPPTPFIPAVDVMSQVMNDPDQFIDCKLWAAKGMGRIARDGNPPIRIKSLIATDLITALADPRADNLFYRMRLIDGLGDCGTMYNNTRQPIVIDGLMKILRDAKEHPMLRAVAARAMTQLPWESDTEVPLITYEICHLAHELMLVRNQEPPNNRGSHWRFTTANFYMAFNPETAEQKALGWGLRNQVTRSGLRGHATLVESAYGVLLPIINTVLRSETFTPVPANQLKDLEGWLQDQNHRPTSWKVTPNSEELPQSEAADQPMAGGDAATNHAGAAPLAVSLP